MAGRCRELFRRTRSEEMEAKYKYQTRTGIYHNGGEDS
jgi:hypothetical protein